MECLGNNRFVCWPLILFALLLTVQAIFEETILSVTPSSLSSAGGSVEVEAQYCEGIGWYLTGQELDCTMDGFLSDQTFTCDIPPGTGGPYHLIAVGDSGNTTFYNLLDYSEPELAVANVSVGGFSLFLSGSNFVPPTDSHVFNVTVFVGDEHIIAWCPLQNFTAQTMECDLPALLVQDYLDLPFVNLTVRTGAPGREMNATAVGLWSPVVLSGTSSPLSIGGDLIAWGENFDENAVAIVILYYTNGTDDNAVVCSLVGYTGVICPIPPRPLSTRAVVRVCTDLSSSCAELDVPAYAAPVVTDVFPPSTAGGSLTLVGTSFGSNVSDVDVLIGVTVVDVVAVTHTEIVVQVPDSVVIDGTDNLSASILTDFFDSQNFSFSYAPPFIDPAVVFTINSTSTTLVINGSSFGVLLSNAMQSICEFSLLHSELTCDIINSSLPYDPYVDFFLCHPDASPGETYDLNITIRGVDLQVWYTAAIPTVTDIQYPPTVGGEVILNGTNLSPCSGPGCVLNKLMNTDAQFHTSYCECFHTYCACDIGAGVGWATTVDFYSALGCLYETTDTSLFRYQPPVIETVELPVTGPDPFLSLYGSNMGGNAVTVSLDDPCELDINIPSIFYANAIQAVFFVAAMPQSKTDLLCANMILSVGGQTDTFLFQYVPPFFDEEDIFDMGDTGIIISGGSFGPSRLQVTVYMGASRGGRDTLCDGETSECYKSSSNWQAHKQIQILLDSYSYCGCWPVTLTRYDDISGGGWVCTRTISGPIEMMQDPMTNGSTVEVQFYSAVSIIDEFVAVYVDFDLGDVVEIPSPILADDGVTFNFPPLAGSFTVFLQMCEKNYSMSGQFAFPVVLNTSAPPTDGDELLVISGLNFGPLETNVAIVYPDLSAAYDCTVTVPHFEMSCFCPEGAAMLDFLIYVTGEPSVANTMHYANITIASFDPSGTVGGDVVLVGSNFGILGSNVTVRSRFGSFVDCNVTVAHTTLECVQPAGHGDCVDLEIVKFEDGVSFTTFHECAGSYGPSNVTSVELILTEGGVLTISGTSFGLLDAIIHPMVDFLANCSVVQEHTVVECTADAVLFETPNRLREVGFSVSGSDGFTSVHTVYDVANITGYIQPNTSGGDIVLFGTSLGFNSDFIGVFLDDVELDCDVVFNHSSVVCIDIPSGYDEVGVLRVVVLGTEVPGSEIPDILYAPPGLLPSGIPATSGSDGVIHGYNFHPTGTVLTMTPGFTCSAYTYTTITCAFAAGQGVHNVTVEVGDQSVSCIDCFTYASPQISMITALPSTTGGTFAFLGSSFGSLSAAITVRILPSDPSFPDIDVSGINLLVPHYQLEMSVGPGMGSDYIVEVCVSSICSLYEDKFTYSVPVVSYAPAQGYQRPYTLNGTVVLEGTSLGMNVSDSLNCNATGIVYNNKLYECTALTNHSMLDCRFPSASGTLTIQLKVCGLLSATFSVPFDYPTIFFADDFPTAGGAAVLYGENFGPQSTSSSVKIDIPGYSVITSSCLTVGSEHDMVSCSVPALGANPPPQVLVNMFALRIQVSMISSPWTGYNFTYKDPQVIASGSPSTSGGAINILGHNFGPAGLSLQLPFANVSVACAVVTAHTAVSCDIPSGSGHHVVTVSSGIRSSSYLLQYGLAYYTSFTAFPTAGGRFNVSGENLDVVGSPINMSLHGYFFESSPPSIGVPFLVNCTVVEDFSVGECVIGPGEGCWNTSISTNFNVPLLCYMPAQISHFSAVSTTGGVIILNGTSLGVDCPDAWFNSEAITCCQLVDHFSLGCEIPPGFGTQNELVLAISEVTSSSFISYAPPAVDVCTDTTTDLGNFTVFGQSFGVNISLIDVTVDGVHVNCTMLEPHTLLGCYFDGSGANLSVVVTVAGQSGEHPTCLSFDAPFVSTYSTVDTSGGEIYINGTGFGSVVDNVEVYIDDIFVPVVLEEAHFHLSATLPAAANFSEHVLVVCVSSQCDGIMFVYDPPIVFAIGYPPTAGGWFTIQGESFGTYSASGTSISSVEGIPELELWCNVSVPHVVISCFAPEGYYFDQLLTLSLAEHSSQYSSFPVLFSFADPQFLSSTSANVTGDMVVFTGVNYGHNVDAYLAFRQIAYNCHDTVNHTSVACTVPAGCGTNFNATLFIPPRSVVVFFDYQAPTVLDISSVSTSGGIVDIVGDNFCGEFPDAVVLTGDSDHIPVHENCTVESHDVILCDIGEGGGAGFTVTVTVGGQVSETPTSATFSYLPPFPVSASSPPSSGGSFTIFGSSFGAAFLSPPVATLIDTSVSVYSCSILVPHEQILCTCGTLMEETGGFINISVVVASLSGMCDNCFRFQSPVITVVGSPGSQGGAFAIEGTNFGYLLMPHTATVDSVPINCTCTIAFFLLSCTIAPGSGGGKNVSVVVDGLESSGGDGKFSYGVPTLSSSSPVPTCGGRITITGSSFGLKRLEVVPILFPGCKMVLSDCVVSVEHTEIQCNASAGVGGPYAFKVDVSGVQSAWRTSLLYIEPSISQISQPPTSGGLVTISGSNFGVDPLLISLLVSSHVDGLSFSVGGGSSCEFVTNHSVITCMCEPGQGDASIVMTVDGRSSAGTTLMFASPSITNSTSPVTQGGTFTIFGSNFGFFDIQLVTVRWDSHVLTCAYGSIHVSVVCDVIAGSGPSHDLEVVVSTHASVNGANVFTYASPVVQNVSRLPTVGGIVTITGANFGPDANTTLVRVFAPPRTFDCNVSVPHTRVVCYFAAGEGSLQPILSVSGLQSSFELRYLAPTISNYTSDLSTSGGTVTIMGSNFGTAPDRVTVKIGSFSCVDLVFTVPHSVMVCSIDSGVGRNLDLVLTVAGQPVVIDDAFSFAHPSISAISPVSFPPSGGVLTVDGESFGRFLANIEITLVSNTSEVVVCDPLDLPSMHRTVLCQLPPVAASSMFWSITLSVLGAEASVPDVVMFCDIQIGEISPLSFPVDDGVVRSDIRITNEDMEQYLDVDVRSSAGVTLARPLIYCWFFFQLGDPSSAVYNLGSYDVDTESVTCGAPIHVEPDYVPRRETRNLYFVLSLEKNVEAVVAFAANLFSIFTLYRNPLYDMSLLPSLGPLRGGTKVTITGEGFLTLPSPSKCRFGHRQSNCSVHNSLKLVCDSPPSVTWGDTEYFSFAADGIHFSQTSMRFRYYRDPSVTSIQPNGGINRGGLSINIEGEFHGSQTYPYVLFLSSFNSNVNSTALSILMSPYEILATSPAWGVPDVCYLSISLNGGYDWHDVSHDITFNYINNEPIEVHRLLPKQIEMGAGPVTVQVFGLGLYEDSISAVLATFPGSMFPLGDSNAGRTKATFTTPELDFLQDYVNTVHVVKFVFDVLPQYAQWQMNVTTVAMPIFYSVEPQFCSRAGRVNFTITGMNFYPSDDCVIDLVSASSGESSVACQFVNNETITFTSPPFPVAETVSIHAYLNGATEHVTGLELTYLLCPAGMFAKSYFDDCTKCDPGFFSASSGASECSPCSPDFYQEEHGRTRCERCPIGSGYPQHGANRKTMCLCDSNHFGPPGGNCSTCPPGAYCDGQHPLPIPLNGFYATADMAIQGIVLTCIPPDVCLGGVEFNLSTTTCRDDFTGPRCSRCPSGYYKNDLECEVCPEFVWGSVFLIAFGILLAATILFVVNYLTLRKGRHDAGRKMQVAKVQMTGKLPVSGASSSSMSNFTTVVLAVNFAQITSIIRSFTVEWPLFLDFFLVILSVINFNIELAGPDCIPGTNYYNLTAAKLLLPVAFAVAFTLVYIVSFLYLQVVRIRAAMNKQELSSTYTHRYLSNVWRAVLSGFVYHFILVYAYLSATAFNYWDCRRLEDGSHVLFVAPDIVCGSDEYYQHMWIPLLGVAFWVIGIPTTLFVFLYRNRLRLEDPDIQCVFGSLFARYKHKWCFWEVVQLLRKVLLTICAVFFGSNVTEAAFFGIVICVLIGFFHSYARPYASNRNNVLEFFALLTNFFLLLFGMAIGAISETLTGILTWFLLALLIVTFVIFLRTITAEFSDWWASVTTKSLFTDSAGWKGENVRYNDRYITPFLENLQAVKLFSGMQEEEEQSVEDTGQLISPFQKIKHYVQNDKSRRRAGYQEMMPMRAGPHVSPVNSGPDNIMAVIKSVSDLPEEYAHLAIPPAVEEVADTRSASPDDPFEVVAKITQSLANGVGTVRQKLDDRYVASLNTMDHQAGTLNPLHPSVQRIGKNLL